MKTTFLTILLIWALSLEVFSQTSVIADPATGPLSFTDLSGNPINANALPINTPVLLRIPIYNLHAANSVPDGSLTIKIGLGSKIQIDPGFDVTTAPLNDRFIWSTTGITGQVEIYGDLYIPLDPLFADVAIFRVRAFTMNSSTITVNLLVTNHNTSINLSDEVPTNNNISLPYTVGKQNQTITFNPLAPSTYGDAPITLTGTASSGLPVSYQSSNSAVATVSGNTLTITGAGTTNITASQAGNGTYNPAPQVIHSFTVNPKVLTISGAVAQNKIYDGTTAAVIDLSSAVLNGVVSPDVITVSGSGTFADPNVNTSISVTSSLVLSGIMAPSYILTQPLLSADITQASQTITFGPLPDKSVIEAPFALAATASSGLPVSYISSDPLVASVSGNIVTIHSIGSTIITASQPGDGNYMAAPDVSQSLTITSTSTVSLKLYLQSYYLAGGTMQPVLMNQGVGTDPLETDSVTVQMRDPGNPSVVVASALGVLQTNGSLTLTFNHPGGNYYLAVLHRNTLQSWTAAPVHCTGTTPLYDFTIAASQVMGNNQVSVEPGVYALYSGDVNQDEFIDSNDFPAIDADSFTGVSGVYTATDLNGDGFVDSNDFPVFDANSFGGVSSIHP